MSEIALEKKLVFVSYALSVVPTTYESVFYVQLLKGNPEDPLTEKSMMFNQLLFG